MTKRDQTRIENDLRFHSSRMHAEHAAASGNLTFLLAYHYGAACALAELLGRTPPNLLYAVRQPFHKAVHLGEDHDFPLYNRHIR